MKLRVQRFGVVGGTVSGTLGALRLLPCPVLAATPNAASADSDAIPEIVINANKRSSSAHKFLIADDYDVTALLEPQYTSGSMDSTPGPAAFFAAPPRTFGLRASFKY